MNPKSSLIFFKQKYVHPIETDNTVVCFDPAPYPLTSILVGGIPTPLENNEFVSWDYQILN